ncbi:MAG: TolB family protein [Planctomycetales bacterium]
MRLTSDGRFKCSPVVCAAGREIVYTELADPTLYRLMKLTVADRTTRPLHADAKTSEFEPAFSSDGKMFAFLRTSGTLRVNLVVQSETGAVLADIPPGPGFSGMRSPAIAPDHSRVVYSFAEGGRQMLFAVRPDGTQRETLVDSTGINNWPAFSPDGRQMAFSSSREGDFEVYTMAIDGSSLQRLTDSPGQDIRPRFSPDGKQIAFTSHRDGNAEVYVMDADGARVRRVTRSPDRDDYPDWLPDSRHLVYAAEQGGKHDLFLIPIDP